MNRITQKEKTGKMLTGGKKKKDWKCVGLMELAIG